MAGYVGRAANRQSMIAIAIMLAILLWAFLGQENFRTVVQTVRSASRPVLEWYFVGIICFFFGAMLWLGVSRYYRVRLGADDEEPEYTLAAWLSMLFAAGTGVGLLFWSIAEPLEHFDSNPFQAGELQNPAALALRLTFFHWGLSGWAIFALIGLCLAYFSFRRNRPLTLRSALEPVIGRHSDGIIGRGFDVVAVIATVFGVTTTLGLGARQVGTGLNEVFGLPGSTWVQLATIAVIIAVATTSVALGLQRGIRRLSEFNVVLAGLLLLFFFVYGPTNHLISMTLEVSGAYLQKLPAQSLFTGATGGADWLNEWTIFYWGWWIAWAPFVGMFIARISRGRTIGEFLLGVFLFPSVFTFIWIGILGGSALHLQGEGVTDLISVVQEDEARALFVTIRELGAPSTLTTLVSGMAILLIAIFFATSADSGTLVINTILSDGSTTPPAWRRISWSIGIGLLTAALILAGGIEILQQTVVLAAVPFSVVLAAMTIGLFRALMSEEQDPRKGRKGRRPRQPWAGTDEPD
ncbi:Glycine betaine transporter OpuD [Jannaschia seosinensis]|uniref:Glycine betaine transporter OpuD n=1 Tax=Jannaschia seosinensis TaxID=313367 RepID=A0A0M7B993_9RHOB|nr:BCCT family transporter [Jannaschia seosinensis]CUH37959.1 Glycine betaine transporter OpuD [Jannaschia seosinensis]